MAASGRSASPNEVPYSIRIVGAIVVEDGTGKHADYEIAVVDYPDSSVRVVRKRYREFRELDTIIRGLPKGERPALSRLPALAPRTWGGGTTDAVISRRRPQLEEYLRALSSMGGVFSGVHGALCSWLDVGTPKPRATVSSDPSARPRSARARVGSETGPRRRTASRGGDEMFLSQSMRVLPGLGGLMSGGEEEEGSERDGLVEAPRRCASCGGDLGESPLELSGVAGLFCSEPCRTFFQAAKTKGFTIRVRGGARMLQNQRRRSRAPASGGGDAGLLGRISGLLGQKKEEESNEGVEEKEEDVHKIGALWKRGGYRGGRKTWKKRVVAVKDRSLFYYRTSSPTLLGVMPLVGAGTVERATGSLAPGAFFAEVEELSEAEAPGLGLPTAVTPHLFVVITPARSLYLCAESARGRDEWVAAIQQLVESHRARAVAVNRAVGVLPALHSTRVITMSDVVNSSETPDAPAQEDPLPAIAEAPEDASSAHRSTPGVRDDESRRWEIAPEEVRVMDRIGAGTFGDVFRGRLWGGDVAVKLLRRVTPDVLESLRAEISVLSQLRHPNVVLFMGACTRPGSIFLVTEWCERGSLYDTLYEPRFPLSAAVRVRLALQTARGMCYLHSSRRGIIHRDLKSHNLLLTRDFGVKVGDFGLTVAAGAEADASATQQTGTPQWMAPEVFEEEPPTPKVDVYGFGVVLCEILTRMLPFSDRYRRFDFIDAVLEEGAVPTTPVWAETVATMSRGTAIAEAMEEEKEAARQQMGAMYDVAPPRVSWRRRTRLWQLDAGFCRAVAEGQSTPEEAFGLADVPASQGGSAPWDLQEALVRDAELAEAEREEEKEADSGDVGASWLSAGPPFAITAEGVGRGRRGDARLYLPGGACEWETSVGACSGALRLLVEACLSRDPGQRPSFEEIVDLLTDVLARPQAEVFAQLEVPRLREELAYGSPEVRQRAAREALHATARAALATVRAGSLTATSLSDASAAVAVAAGGAASRPSVLAIGAAAGLSPPLVACVDPWLPPLLPFGSPLTEEAVARARRKARRAEGSTGLGVPVRMDDGAVSSEEEDNKDDEEDDGDEVDSLDDGEDAKAAKVKNTNTIIEKPPSPQKRRDTEVRRRKEITRKLAMDPSAPASSFVAASVVSGDPGAQIAGADMAALIDAAPELVAALAGAVRREDVALRWSLGVTLSYAAEAGDTHSTRWHATEASDVSSLAKSLSISLPIMVPALQMLAVLLASVPDTGTPASPLHEAEDTSSSEEEEEEEEEEDFGSSSFLAEEPASTDPARAFYAALRRHSGRLAHGLGLVVAIAAVAAATIDVAGDTARPPLPSSPAHLHRAPSEDSTHTVPPAGALAHPFRLSAVGRLAGVVLQHLYGCAGADAAAYIEPTAHAVKPGSPRPIRRLIAATVAASLWDVLFGPPRASLVDLLLDTAGWTVDTDPAVFESAVRSAVGNMLGGQTGTNPCGIAVQTHFRALQRAHNSNP